MKNETAYRSDGSPRRRCGKRVPLPVVTLLGVLVIAGIGTKLYSGRFELWVHNYAGAIVYEVFWIVLLGVLLPRTRIVWIAASVLIVTCGLEFLQLWHPPFLEIARSNFVGRALLGNGFDRWDFVYYVIGSLLGWLIGQAISPRPRRSGADGS